MNDKYELKSISVEWDIEDIKSEMEYKGIEPTEENIQKVIDNGLHKAIEEAMKQGGWDAINTLISDTF